MPITDWPEAERPREKLLARGATTLSDAELLAVFIRTGLRGQTALDLARDWLSRFEGLRGLLDAERSVLGRLPGMGPAKYAELASLERLGYRVEWRQLRACDYGAGTRRKRLFMMAMRDGEAVHWPEPTHFEKPRQGERWSWAADHIDWSDLGVSIFLDKAAGRLQGVRRPLAEATMRRIAKGIKREVLDRAQPFIVSCNHGGAGFRGQAIDEPLCTLTASRDAHGLVVPKLAPFITEHANGSIQRNMPVDDPLRTICAQVKGGHFALATAFLAQANGGFNVTASLPADSPLSVITTTGSQQQLVSCTLSPDDEAGALQVAAFLMQYYGEGGSQSGAVDQPLGVITTRDRLALVTVWISGAPYVIVDIRLRMLKPRELYSCQGFPKEYVIDRGHDGKRFTLGAQTHIAD